MLFAFALGVVTASAQNKVDPAIRLQFSIVSKGSPLDVKSGGISRFEFLLSELALKDSSGKWIPSEDWFAHLSAAEGKLHADTVGSPSGDYQAIRFRIGLDSKTDLGDPAQWAPGHPLHPDVNHLHWGWQGGYVHLACEGKSARGPFSYHLAGQETPMIVELPVRFHGGGPVTLAIQIDADRILSMAEEEHAPNATHSRPGDDFAKRMKARTVEAISFSGLSYDLFQTAQPSAAIAEKLPKGTHPYPLAVTRRFPQVLHPADNPLTLEGVALGKRLFFDPILSINGSQSCASCHAPEAAFSDPRRLSLGAHGQPGKRNSMSLFNLAWSKEGLFWDGRAKSLREQVLMPITDPSEMGESISHVVAKLQSDASYSADFQKAHAAPISAETLSKSLEQYLLTLIAQDSRFDRAARKQATLTDEEKLGLSLFVTENDPARGLRGADCFHCHGGTLFTDNQFHNNGLRLDESDTGRMNVTDQASDRGKFKTPTLRNIARTAPYMHDGRFATLEEVVEHYNSGISRSETLDPNLGKHPASGLGLSDTEKKALVAFLRTLSEEVVEPQTAARP
jgi:cytochrome c peroxidase